MKTLWISLVLVFCLSMAVVTRFSVNNGGATWPVVAVFIAFFSLMLFLGLWKPMFKSPIYAIALFAWALSILLSRSLIGYGLMGGDIYAEYHAYRVTAEAGMWVKEGVASGCLSVSLLPFILEKLTGIGGLMWFRAGLLVLVALTPAVCFYAFREHIGTRLAYWGSMLLVLQETFFYTLSGQLRLGLAMFCLSLLVYVLFNWSHKKRTITALALIGMLVVSYYVMAVALSATLLLYWLLSRLVLRRDDYVWLFAAYSLVGTIIWWGFINGWLFSFFFPLVAESVTTAYLGITSSPTIAYEIYGWSSINSVPTLPAICVTVGMLALIFRLRRKIKFAPMVLLGFSAWLIFLLAIMLPVFSLWGGLNRLFLMLSVLWVPCFSAGVLFIVKLIRKLGTGEFRYRRVSILLLSCYLVCQFQLASNLLIYPLFFPETFVGKELFSTSDHRYIVTVVEKEEMEAARWIGNDSRNTFGEFTVYVGTQRYPDFTDVFELTPDARRAIVKPLHQLKPGQEGYVLLGQVSSNHGKMTTNRRYEDIGEEITAAIKSKQLVYSSGNVEVYK